LPTTAEYRERATLARQHAECAPTRQLRKEYLELANAWARLATLTDPGRIVVPGSVRFRA
jgi:hypothetical protein